MRRRCCVAPLRSCGSTPWLDGGKGTGDGDGLRQTDAANWQHFNPMRKLRLVGQLVRSHLRAVLFAEIDVGDLNMGGGRTSG